MNGFTLYIPAALSILLLFFTLNQFFAWEGDRKRVFWKGVLGSAVYILLLLSFPYDKNIFFQQSLLLGICLGLTLVTFTLWQKLSQTQQKFRSSLLIMFFIILLLGQLWQLNNIFGPTAPFFSDPGPINTVNTLRGEDQYSLLGKILHNRSILVYKYLENIAAVFSPALISRNFLVGVLIPLLIGVYFFVNDKFQGKGVLVAYVAATGLTLGFLRPELLDYGFFLLTPVIAILVVIGLEKLIKR